MKTLFLLLFFFICIESNAQKDSTTTSLKNYLSFELDPAPFILGGYSFSLKFSAQKLSHFTFMGSVYSSKFPDRMMDKHNSENGYRNMKINTSLAFFTDYFIKSDRSGFHFGPSVFLYSKTVESIYSSEVTNFNSLYPNVRLGYVYRPFIKSGFYINPWFNLGKEFILDNNNSVEGKKFSTKSISYVVALHLGYQIPF